MLLLVHLPSISKETSEPYLNPRKRKNPAFSQVEHLLSQPKRNIERKQLIDLGYSRYWSITYKNGAFQHIPVTKTGKPVPIKGKQRKAKKPRGDYRKRNGRRYDYDQYIEFLYEIDSDSSTSFSEESL